MVFSRFIAGCAVVTMVATGAVPMARWQAAQAPQDCCADGCPDAVGVPGTAGLGMPDVARRCCVTSDAPQPPAPVQVTNFSREMGAYVRLTAISPFVVPAVAMRLGRVDLPARSAPRHLRSVVLLI